MMTLSEHNRQARQIKENRIKMMYKSGVACDTCGVEMLYTEVNERYGLPRSLKVRCPECGVVGVKEDVVG